MVSSGLCPHTFWGERKQEPEKGQRMKCHLTFYALHHMHKWSCRRLHTRSQVLFRSRPQRSCDVRYYCWCHSYLWSLAQPTDASQSARCLESVVYFRIEIGVSISFLEIANLSTCASVFTGFSTVCFHSPEAFWSQKLAQKPILSLQQTNARLTLSLRRNSSRSSTHSLLRPPVRDSQLPLGGLWGLSAGLTLVRLELQMQLLPPRNKLAELHL